MGFERRLWLGALVVVALLLVLAIGAYVLTRPSAEPETAASPTAPAATADWYQLYFTSPRYPDDPKSHSGGIDQHLVDLIDRASQTLDVADYDFDLMSVADAMARAKQRGVRVRMVTDTDTLTNDDDKIQAAFKRLATAGIPIADDQRSAIMHDKFTVVDGEWVSTGSWNYTEGDTYRLNNNLAIIHSRELAANYTAEFEQMFVDHRFGPSKKTRVPNPTVTIDDTLVRSCFSPEGHCSSLVIDAVNSAQQSIRFLAFSFTDDPTAEAMLAKARAGVTVQGIFETTGSNTQYSEYGKMKSTGLDVYTDGNPYSMHHKVVIVDDHLVVFGSFNFSDSADNSNDENLLVVDNRAMAQAFTAEFQRVLEVAKNPPPKSR